MASKQHLDYIDSSRGNIISEYFVVAAVVPVENEVKDLSHFVIQNVNTKWLKKYVDLECSYVWGIKQNEEGLLKLVDLTTPIQKDLDGYGIIHKSHKVFKINKDIDYAKEQLAKCINEAYIAEKSISTT